VLGVTDLFSPLTFSRGPAWPNRLGLAPLTNTQSHPDGQLSDEELHWLAMRARGGFGLVMTCAAHVQQGGQGFPGQLGVWSDDHLPGLRRIAGAVRDAGSVSAVQLHHAGIRSPQDLVGQPVGASDDAETGARALTTEEVEQVTEDFVLAALRVQEAGFDGVELHGAHGYLLAQFLSVETNRRTDRYGGGLQQRARLLMDVLEGIRSRCRPDLQVGLRLSPERFGMQLGEVRDLAAELLRSGALDYLDMSLWDVSKDPVEEQHREQRLMAHFTALDRGDVRLGVAGKVMTAAQARACLEDGADFVLLGRAAVLHHDFPLRAQQDPAFAAVATPVEVDYLREQGLSPAFIDYMRGWRNFVA
jgi:2,4-dienoyl-CoA reductase-like NADH-dependent reductase (Old Yellow Enzyme family)